MYKTTIKVEKIGENANGYETSKTIFEHSFVESTDNERIPVGLMEDVIAFIYREEKE